MIRWMILSTLATGLFYALYTWLFRRDRWFELSRAYIFITLGFCSLFPWLRLPESVTTSGAATEFLLSIDSPEVIVGEDATLIEPVTSWRLDILPTVCIAGVVLSFVVLLAQLTMQSVHVRRLRRKYPVYGRANGYAIPEGALLILVPDDTEPFSFFKNIVVGTRDLSDEELHSILAHESLHVRERHSLEIVLMRFVCCCQWFNPFVWLMLRELRAVHEYQADAAALSGSSPKLGEVDAEGGRRSVYLRLLYRQTTGFGYGHITNNFHSINLKKRIVMMNAKKSRFGAWKVLTVLPVAALLMAVGGRPAESQVGGNQSFVPAEEPVAVGDTTRYNVVEVDPEFPGGMEALYKYLAENIHYPEKAKENKVQGRVMVRFVIEKDGRVSNAEVLRGIGDGCNEEALRVVNAMPKWTPGKVRDEAVRVNFTLPITFRLQ